MDHNCLDVTTPNSRKWHSECKAFFFPPNDCIHLKKYSTRYAHGKYNKTLWVCSNWKSKRKSKQDEESLEHVNHANLKELELQGALSLWTVVITSNRTNIPYSSITFLWGNMWCRLQNADISCYLVMLQMTSIQILDPF